MITYTIILLILFIFVCIFAEDSGKAYAMLELCLFMPIFGRIFGWW